jgi:hypothetical protein
MAAENEPRSQKIPRLKPKAEKFVQTLGLLERAARYMISMQAM